MSSQESEPQLAKTLSPLMIWGLGVGYVISGEYFGWNLGLAHGGPYGMLAATLIVTVMYVSFVLSYAELACAIPKAGGAFVYAQRAFGPRIGLLAGTAQWIEFVFAPPAIAFAIGAYFANFTPGIPPLALAMGAYVTFTALNMWGVKQSAIFELVITILAVGELLLFAGVTAPAFQWSNFSENPLPNGWWGVLPALPFAIWFYLAIEGVANIAEEAKNPQRDISRGFLYSIGTLVFLALLVFFTSIGVAGWEQIVYDPQTGETSDSPLPLALGFLLGTDHPLFHLLITVGLFGLIASFHGILLVAGRATFEFGRAGYFPRVLGDIHPTRQTPVKALIFNLCVGFVALVSGKTSDIITLSVFGALALYIISMFALLKLRKSEPDLERPYRAPGFPYIPYLALGLALGCFVAVFYYNLTIGMIFLAIVGLAFAYFSQRGDRQAEKAAS
jgi:ethanolamine permease